ncbi:Hypothetical predicted protein [Pelobates cultripes]|uniref:Uncharacterized protein n=1 Tax=Pelobates cultripes TaxID=61616 RepID=A0AAD1WHY4_PELCU|nr:Hypothetical predicted protein [Pelobates cultripes]
MIVKGVPTSKYYLDKTRDASTWTGPTEQLAQYIDNSSNAAIVQQTDAIKQGCTMPADMPMETALLLSPSSQQSIPVENMDTLFSNISSVTRVSEMDSTLNVSEFKDPIYSPEEETTDIGDLTFLTEPSPEDYVSERKFFVFETSLDFID